MNLFQPFDIQSFLGYPWDPAIDNSLAVIVTAHETGDDWMLVSAVEELFEELVLRRGIYE